jgi:hypothetical protein
LASQGGELLPHRRIVPFREVLLKPDDAGLDRICRSGDLDRRFPEGEAVNHARGLSRLQGGNDFAVSLHPVVRRLSWPELVAVKSRDLCHMVFDRADEGVAAFRRDGIAAKFDVVR